MTPEFLELLSSLSPALIAFVGVLVGGLITAAIEWQKMNREADRQILKEAVAVMQGARLLSNDLVEAMAALKTAKDDPKYHLNTDDLICPSWRKYEAALTTYLPGAELEKVLHALYAGTNARHVDINAPSTRPADRVLLVGAVFIPMAEAREVLTKYVDLPTAVQAVRHIHAPAGLWNRLTRGSPRIGSRTEA
jgi:hypothetical protein